VPLRFTRPTSYYRTQTLKTHIGRRTIQVLVKQVLRVVPFKKRTAIAFEIDENKKVVAILRVFYGGQDYAAILNSARQRKSVKSKN
jgi:hypothetical protein